MCISSSTIYTIVVSFRSDGNKLPGIIQYIYIYIIYNILFAETFVESHIIP